MDLPEPSKRTHSETQAQAIQSFQNLSLLRSLEDPSLSRFIPDLLLGVGAQGLVVKAWDRDLLQWVAIKIKASTNPLDRKPFAREFLLAKLAQQTYGKKSPLPLSHELISTAGTTFHTMELLPQRLLEDEWDDPTHQKKLSEANHLKRSLSDLVSIGLDLKKIHELGFVHLDIKPQNVVMGYRDPRIIDPGMAIKYDKTTGKAIDRAQGQTRDFASPEQRDFLDHLTSDYQKIGPASDVYSYAKMIRKYIDQCLVELNLEPRLPWQIETSNRLIDFKIQTLSRAFNKNPAERPPANEVAEALRNVITVIP